MKDFKLGLNEGDGPTQDEAELLFIRSNFQEDFRKFIKGAAFLIRDETNKFHKIEDVLDVLLEWVREECTYNTLKNDFENRFCGNDSSHLRITDLEKYHYDGSYKGKTFHAYSTEPKEENDTNKEK